MSDHYLILIPEEAGFVPPEAARAEVLEKFRSIAQTEELSVELTENVRFEHCGGYFGKIFCPNCEKEIGLDWWQEQMDEDFGKEKSFKLKAIKLPCCGAVKTLHELRYESPQGFARFSLSALEPKVFELSAETLMGMETVAQCKLRAIYRRI